MAFNGSSASTDYDNEGYILAESAKVVRRDMLKKTQQPFSGGLLKIFKNAMCHHP